MKASASINGNSVYKWLKYESGVHRVQRVPKTERTGRLHTSTMTVAILPQPKEVSLASRDIVFHVYLIKLCVFRLIHFL